MNTFIKFKKLSYLNKHNRVIIYFIKMNVYAMEIKYIILIIITVVTAIYRCIRPIYIFSSCIYY